MLTRAVMTAVLILGFGPVLQAHELHMCDYMATNPSDPDKLIPGIGRSDIDLPKAIAACKQAMEDHPDEPRFSYNLGRVVFYAGDRPKALELWEISAAQGYRQSSFLVGLVINRKYDDLPQDPCLVEQAWAESAKLDHFNAQVSYVHSRVNGVFDGCDMHASEKEMAEFLDAAAPDAGYLGRILISDLRKEF